MRVARQLHLAAALLVAALIVLPGVSAQAAGSVREYQWYLPGLELASAHKVSKGEGQIVAVIDSGVDATHPDLADRVLPGHGIGADAAVDGREDSGESGHGTAMASIIAGGGLDKYHLLGVAPQAQILPISLGPSITSDEVAQGIRWAVDNGATVINLSLGSTHPGTANDDEIQAVRYAIDHNVVLVAAAGNNQVQGDRVASPGNIPGVLTVSGLDRNGQLWTGSCVGPEVVLAAPAVEVIAGVPERVSDNGYVITDGTSAASALAAGTVALVRSAYPELDAANVIERLLATATDLGPSGRDEQYGFGEIQPAAALNAEVATVTDYPIATPTADRAAKSGDERSQWRVDRNAGERMMLTGILVVGVLLLFSFAGWALWQGFRRRHLEVVEREQVVPAPRSGGEVYGSSPRQSTAPHQ